MIIENYKGIFEQIENSTLEIERTNPLLNEQGSASLPYRIKRTPHNDYLLGFPDRYDRKHKYEVKQAFNMRSGVISENANFKILSVDDENIEGVFYLNESSFYNQIKEIKLTTVFDGIERWFQPESVPREERIAYIVNMLNKMITSLPDNEYFTIFPAVVNAEVYSGPETLLVGGISKVTNVINEIERFETETFPIYRLKGTNKYEIKDGDDNTITIPVGYAISPFLKFNYVLRKIFEYFGLVLEENIFDTDPKLSKWIVLNNTMDAIMAGYFVESNLVPDCTINDFLDVVRESLCSDFFINLSNKTARLVLFNDILDSSPDLDLTPYLSSFFEKIEINDPKQVKLTTNKNLPYSSTSTDTIEEFKKKYSDYTPEKPLWPTEGIFPYSLQNSIWKIYDRLPSWLGDTFKADRLSSLNFNYDTSEDIEREEHNIPMEALGTAYFSKDGITFFYAPVVGSMRNLNSHVILDGTKQIEEQVECPIMISCEGWDLPARVGFQYNNNQYLDYKNSILLWGDNSLFNRFWKRYDGLLRSSFVPITYRFRLPAYLLHNFKFEYLKIVNGQKMIVVSLKYILQDQDFVNVEMLLKTVKVYE